MAKERLAVTEMVMNLVLGKNQTDGRVTYFPQKPSFWETDAVQIQPFERATPESQGIASEQLRTLLLKLATSPGMEMHHFMALRHGKVICECDFSPYPRGMWHITHSMCKSITGMAIGMLIEEGKLHPCGIIGVPVGFVNVVEAKELIMRAPVPYIVARGRKGGSNIAAAICNALLYELRDMEK